jgi:AGZA family xanthine/uracil permease-like MFS transporter
MTYFGFMHGPAVGLGNHGLGVTPGVALAYLVIAVFLLGLAMTREFARGVAPKAVPAE